MHVLLRKHVKNFNFYIKCRNLTAYRGIALLMFLSQLSCNSNQPSRDPGNTGGSPANVTPNVTQYSKNVSAAFQNGLVVGAPTAFGVAAATGSATDLYDVQSSQRTIVEKAASWEALGKLSSEKELEICRPFIRYLKNTRPNCYAKPLTATEGSTETTSPLLRIPLDLKPLNAGATRGLVAGDALIVSEKEGSNACITATLNYELSPLVDTVDRAQEFLMGLQCAARLSGRIKLPDGPGKMRLEDEAKKIWNLPASAKLEEAWIEKLATDDATFHTVIKITTLDPAGLEKATLIDFVNAPEKANDSNSKGRLIVLETAKNWKAGQIKVALNLNFSRNNDGIKTTILKLEAPSDVKVLDFFDVDNGTFIVDKNSKVTELMQATLGVNLKEGTGDLVLAHQPKITDAFSRVVMSNSLKLSDSAQSGCGIVGHSESFLSKKQGSIKGISCGWNSFAADGADLSKVIQPFVQSQCFKKNTKDDFFESVSQKLKYVVAGDCGKGSADPQLKTWADLENVTAPDSVGDYLKSPKPLEITIFPLSKADIEPDIPKD